jgi:hypothetical protein
MNTGDFCESIDPRRSLLSDPIEPTNGKDKGVSALRPVPFHSERPGNGIEQIIKPLI